VEVEHRRDQPDREHQACDDAPAQFEPDGEQRDLMAEPLALHIAPVQVIRKDRQTRAKEQFKHRSMPMLLMRGDRGGFRIFGGLRALAGRDTGHVLRRPGDSAQRRTKVGKVDDGEQQAGNPEDVLMREQRQEPEHCNDLELQFCDLCAIRSGSVCRRRNSSPTPSTARTRNTAITTIKISVSSGAVMNGGKWWGASGLADVLKLLSGVAFPNHEPVSGDMQCLPVASEALTYLGTQNV